MELVSSNNATIEAGDYQIIRIDDADRISWSVEYPASEWPKSIAFNFDGWPTEIDAAMVHSNSNLYLFSGREYYRILPNTDLRVDFVGEIGVDGWYNVPPDIDAAFFHSNDKAYFFKEDSYYRYVDGDVDKIGRIGVDGWEGVPSNLDSALITPAGNVHFFKGDEFWRYHDGAVDKQSTVGSGGWFGVPSSVDGAFSDGYRYLFFKGGSYWGYQDGTLGGAFAYDVFVMDEENCEAFVNGYSYDWDPVLSKTSIRESSEAKATGLKYGDWCVIFDNTERGDAEPPSRSDNSLFLVWKIEAGG
jgi:hypothetical protein